MNSPWFKLALWQIATFCTTLTGDTLLVKIVEAAMADPDKPIRVHWMVWAFILLHCVGQCAINARTFVDQSLSRHLDEEKAKDDASKV